MLSSYLLEKQTPRKATPVVNSRTLLLKDLASQNLVTRLHGMDSKQS